MHKNVVIIGAGGHAKVIADIIKKSGDTIVGFLDDNKKIGEHIILNYKVIGNLADRISISKSNPDYEFIIAIGDNKKRKEISQLFKLKFYTAIHPSAQIGLSVEIQEGTTIMANTCINPLATIGLTIDFNT